MAVVVSSKHLPMSLLRIVSSLPFGLSVKQQNSINFYLYFLKIDMQSSL